MIILLIRSRGSNSSKLGIVLLICLSLRAAVPATENSHPVTVAVFGLFRPERIDITIAAQMQSSRFRGFSRGEASFGERSAVAGRKSWRTVGDQAFLNPMDGCCLGTVPMLCALRKQCAR